MTVEQYLANMPVERRSRYAMIMQLIVDAFPDAAIDMQYRMPTFHNDDKGWCALANQKHYISLYTCGEKNIADFKAHHPNIKCGKGCLNFRDGDDLPMDDLKLVIDNAMFASVKCGE